MSLSANSGTKFLVMVKGKAARQYFLISFCIFVVGFAIIIGLFLVNQGLEAIYIDLQKLESKADGLQFGVIPRFVFRSIGLCSQVRIIQRSVEPATNRRRRCHAMDEQVFVHSQSSYSPTGPAASLALLSKAVG